MGPSPMVPKCQPNDGVFLSLVLQDVKKVKLCLGSLSDAPTDFHASPFSNGIT